MSAEYEMENTFECEGCNEEIEVNIGTGDSRNISCDSCGASFNVERDPLSESLIVNPSTENDMDFEQEEDF